MARAIEAVIDKRGSVRLLEQVQLANARRALVIFLDDDSATERRHETTLLSEAALADDWSRPEEDAAWSYLRPVK